MNESIIYALISLVFAGVNDTLFKRQAISGQCRGQYMIIAGLVWTLVFLTAAFFQNEYLPTSTTLVYGIIVGMFSAIANYLLIYSMQKLEAGVAATIYRLNMAAAAFLAIVFLHEDIHLSKIAGISMAVLSIILFFEKTSSKFSLIFFIAVLASLLRAFMGIGYKVAISKGVQLNLFLAGSGICWIVVGIFGASLNNRKFELHNGNILLGSVSGVLICGIVFFFAKALANGQASIIIPIAQMSFVVTTILAWFYWREKISLKAIIGMVFACLSIFLLSRS